MQYNDNETYAIKWISLVYWSTSYICIRHRMASVIEMSRDIRHQRPSVPTRPYQMSEQSGPPKRASEPVPAQPKLRGPSRDSFQATPRRGTLEDNPSSRTGPPRVINHNFTTSPIPTRSNTGTNAQETAGFPFDQENSFRGPYDGMPASPRTEYRPGSRPRGSSWLGNDGWNPVKMFTQSPRAEHSTSRFLQEKDEPGTSSQCSSINFCYLLHP